MDTPSRPVRGLPNLKRFVIVTGHYGTGKTNFSVNLAIDTATATGQQVTLVDLDIVNPYFRSSDYVAMLARRGVRVIAPTFAGTTLETPSLPAEVYSVFESVGPVILDVGGDDAGATALGRFSANVAEIDHDMLYVVNRYRNLTVTADEAAALLHEIEGASHLRATGIVNNSHLQQHTAAETVLSSVAYGRDVSKALNLPLVCTTVPAHLADLFINDSTSDTFIDNAYPVEVYVRPPWDDVVF